MNYAIETIGLTKTFSDAWGRRKVFAVDNLSLKIQSNEVFGLLGPNGSGKSTTIKMLLGLLHPTKGHSLIFGGDGADPKINKRVGFLPEESYLYRYLNPRETLDFYGKLFGLPRRVRRERAEALLEMVGLKAVASRSVGTFSKGMARRIGLAQALINDPDLIVLDEPTTGLDPIGTREMKDLILRLKSEGKTVVMCSHLLADVQDVCDRIAILYQGELKELGRVDSLLTVRDVTQIRAEGLSDEAKEEIRRVIERHGANVLGIENPTTTLEELFLNIVRESEARPGRRATQSK